MSQHPAAGGARQAGADHRRLRLPVRLRRRQCRRADHGGGRRPRLGDPRRDRLPQARVGFHGLDENLGLESATRSSPRVPGRRRSTVPCGGTAPGPATRRSRRSSVSGQARLEAGVTFLRSSTPRRGRRAPDDAGGVHAQPDDVDDQDAGVYSFPKHAARQADRYGVSGAKILLEAGRRQPDRRPGGPAHRQIADAASRRAAAVQRRLRPGASCLPDPADPARPARLNPPTRRVLPGRQRARYSPRLVAESAGALLAPLGVLQPVEVDRLLVSVRRVPFSVGFDVMVCRRSTCPLVDRHRRRSSPVRWCSTMSV